MESIEAVNILKKEFDENKNSHVFLLETNNLEHCLTDVKEICKNIIKTDDEIAKRQIEDETYLELIIIRPEGKEIKKDQILNLQERLKTKPILADYLIYIIIPAESMSDISANKLLKTIEEPNRQVIGFLITSNSDLLLPTIKSRCEIVSMMYDTSSENTKIEEELIRIATDLVEAIENRDHVKFAILKANDKIIKENAKIIENLIKDYYNTACNLSKNDILDIKLVSQIQKNNKYDVLIKKAKYINKTLNKLTKNMNTDLLLEKLFIELKDVS